MSEFVFTVHPTPIADVLLACTEDGLVSLEVLDEDPRALDRTLAGLAATLHAVPGRDDDCAHAARTQLDEYFARTRRVFELDLDWRLVRGFARDALEAACEIPYAHTAGYGEVAVMAGRPGAARAVGNACSRSPFSIVVPVHRVVHADGTLGGYGGRVRIKQALLEHERAGTGV